MRRVADTIVGMSDRSPAACFSMLRTSLLLALFSVVPLVATEGQAEAVDQRRDNLLIVTIDTARADAIGSYGGGAKTPTLDRLAARGVRYERALTPSPLTLPAHTSILTGIDPPQHGVRDNGIDALPTDIPTLASILQEEGYDTAAFVSSLVLDRRFGLARGFDAYGDRMTADRVGQYGYPERDAAAVTAEAQAWLENREGNAPFFLWIHYYDAHAPYTPPAEWRGKTPYDDYLGELAYVDQQVERLLHAASEKETLVAILGDHGEMLGEHGEEGHGIFIYESALRVPLILAGPGLPRGNTVDRTVGTVQLASSLLRALDIRGRDAAMQPPLPGLGGEGGTTFPIFSEALLPAHAYGWSPLQALSEDRWRYISAPRPELYDVRKDPAEADNLFTAKPEEASRLATSLQRRTEIYGEREGDSVGADASLDASLRSLGYLSTSGGEASDIDPKDGMAWLAERDQAKRWLAEGKIEQAAQTLRRLVQLNPQNQTFLAQYARALFGLGRKDEGISVYRQAVALNPKLEFLHTNLAQALLENGEKESAAKELRLSLSLNPRSSGAALLLAELLAGEGRGAEEKLVLERAAEAGADSAGIHIRLGQFASRDREFEVAERHLAKATELEPRQLLGWLLRAMNSEAAGRPTDALNEYQETIRLEPRQGTALFRYGRLLARQGSNVEATAMLQRALSTRISAAERQEAEGILRSLSGSPG